MDHADSQLAGRTQPFQHSLAGTDAGHGESSIMTTPSFYTDGQGKGHLPLQPHPKNKTKAVYTEELTHLPAEDLTRRRRAARKMSPDKLCRWQSSVGKTSRNFLRHHEQGFACYPTVHG